MLRRSYAVGAVAAATFVAAASGSFAWTLRVTCRDGAADALAKIDGHHRRLPVCDLDGAADGVCTFYSNAIVLKCRTGGGAGCQDVRDDSPPPPCPFYDRPIAVPLRPGGKRTTFKHVDRPEAKRLPPERLVLQCLPAAGPVATTTTTTLLLPGVMNLTGDWTRMTSESTRGCPTDINNPMLSSQLTIIQTGSALSACASGFLPLEGTTSNGSFSFQPYGDLDTGSETNNWNVTISGTGTDTGVVRIDERWRTASGLTPGCENVWEGTMTPRIGPACASHSDCIATGDPCSRCIDGECRQRPPFCRSSFQ